MKRFLTIPNSSARLGNFEKKTHLQYKTSQLSSTNHCILTGSIHTTLFSVDPIATLEDT